MGMGTRKAQEKQEDIWIANGDLARSPGHPFYQRLNELLDGEKFDEFAEGLCGKFYAARMGRPGLAPGVYFRSLLIGYFEGIDSERGIAWRLADSLALRQFVRIGITEQTPDHSTISRTRRLIDLETHRAVFGWVLGLLADRGLIQGKRVGVDATTLEASAAMRSIVRRDTGASYEEFLTGLAKASGMGTPTREELARLDRKRKKRTSNKEWMSPADRDARIAKMKDGRTHLAHKAEHAVDLDTGAVVAVTLQEADKGDTTTLDLTLCEAGEAVAELAVREAKQRPDEKPKVNVAGIEEMVADKGYHSGAVVERVKNYQVRSYIPERQQKGRRNWEGKAGQQQAVYANRRRVQGNHGKSLLKRRGELVERSFAHCYDTGGMRRTHLRKHNNILKRQLIHIAGFNLSLIFRRLLGAGTPREWNNLGGMLFLFLLGLFTRRTERHRPCRSARPESHAAFFTKPATPSYSKPYRKFATYSTGC
jgi:transposase